MKKDKYTLLREKTKRIVKEGLKMVRDKEFPLDDSCSEKCASCLAASARGRTDRVDYDYSFDSSEDVCMLDARDILAKKLNFEIN